MRTIDFREFLANELQDSQARRNFVIAYYEEDGIAGLQAALEEIALADARVAQGNAVNTSRDNADWRASLNELGLDLRLVLLQEPAEASLTPA